MKNQKNQVNRKVYEASSAFWRIGYRQEIGARTEQQDDYLICQGIFHGQDALLALVADGMGGMYDGALFSRIVCESHASNFEVALNRYETSGDVLLFLALEAEKEAHTYYNEDKPGGSTLISALITGNRFCALSVGDSRICLFRRPEGQERPAGICINREHTLGVALDERAWMGYISMDDAEGNYYRNTLTACIGADRLRRLDLMMNPVQFTAGDRLVLMSDGVYRPCPEEEMANLLDGTPQEAADRIVDSICDRRLPKQDNMTVLIIESLMGKITGAPI